MSKEFMFDTNVFGDILDGELDLEKIRSSEAEIWITPVQKKELKQHQDEDIRSELLDIAEAVSSQEGGEPAVFGHSRYGEAVYQGGEVYEPVKRKLDGEEDNVVRDAQIAQAAFMQDAVLVTADGESKEGLQDVLDEVGQNYMSRSEFKRWLDERQ